MEEGTTHMAEVMEAHTIHILVMVVIQVMADTVVTGGELDMDMGMDHLIQISMAGMEVHTIREWMGTWAQMVL